MMLFSPHLARPQLGQFAISLGAVAVVATSVVTAPLSNPIADVLDTAGAEIVVALEIQTSTGATIYAATRDFITRSTDTPASTPVRGTLDASLVVTQSIVGGVGFSGYSKNVSEFSLINDGLYDAISDGRSVNGQRITCKIGTCVGGVVAAYSSFVTVSRHIGGRWLPRRDRLAVELSDDAARLAVPAQSRVYQGTGGLEGGTELQGKKFPRVFGPATNISPVLVAPAEGLFQVNSGAVSAISAVRDGGIALQFFADYATVALLRAALVTVPAVVVPGFYATCVADGYFGIGGTAFKQVTADVLGDATLTGYVSTTSDVIRRLVLLATDLAASEIDSSSLADLTALQSAQRGYYLGPDDNKTVADVMTELMRGIGGFWYLSTDGILRLRRFDAPGLVASATYDLAGGFAEKFDRVDLPDSVDPPPRRQRVTYAHNWTQQTDLYGQVSELDPATAAYYATPYKVAATPDGDGLAILAAYPFAPDPDPVLGFIADATTAQAEASRQLTLYSSGYDLFSVTLHKRVLVHQIGDVILLKDTTVVPRLSLGTPRYVRVVQAQDSLPEMKTELLVFG